MPTIWVQIEEISDRLIVRRIRAYSKMTECASFHYIPHNEKGGKNRKGMSHSIGVPATRFGSYDAISKIAFVLLFSTGILHAIILQTLR